MFVRCRGAGEKPAERLGAPVFGSSWPGHIAFPTCHPLWRGTLPTQAAYIRECLSAYDGIFLLGADTIITYIFTEGAPVPEGCEVLHLSSYAGDLARSFPTAFACTGDLLASVEALLPLLSADGAKFFILEAGARRAERDVDLYSQLDEAVARDELSPLVAAGQIARAIGPVTPVVDEAPATMNLLRQFLHSPSGNTSLVEAQFSDGEFRPLWEYLLGSIVSPSSPLSETDRL